MFAFGIAESQHKPPIVRNKPHACCERGITYFVTDRDRHSINCCIPLQYRLRFTTLPVAYVSYAMYIF